MKHKNLIFIGILLLAFFAGNFVYPDYYNKGIDFINQKLSLSFSHFWTKPFRLGLDLQGGVSLIYEADLTNIDEGDKAEVMVGLKDVIERRVNLFGITEPSVQASGENRLIVELAGVKDINEAIQMIGETPYLEFLELRSEEETQQIIDKQKEVEGKTFEELETIENWELAFQNPYFKPTELTGKYLKKSQVNFDNTTFKPTIQLQFNDEGSTIFEQVTERNTGKPLAIFLDGASIVDTDGDGEITAQDVYAPIVQGKISGGRAVITGDMSTQRANEIVRRLNSGALPVKIGEPVSQKIVGPTLGEVSLRESLWAGILGFIAILAFLIIFYRIPGLLASFSLLLYIVLMLALVKLFGVVLTLAGIAGFILSMGMAVDANILIFSRMREEIKSGKTFKESISEGLKRAWPSVRDGNFTTILVALILFFLGTSFVKGFALTLMLGNIIGMLTSIFVTNYFLKFFSGERTPKPMWLWH